MRIPYLASALLLCSTVAFAQPAPTPTEPPPPAAATPAAPEAPPTATPAPAAAQPPAAPMLPLAGYANGSFFIRDPGDWFTLFPRGRLQVDWYNFLNRGDAPAGVVPNSSADTRPKNTLFVRRARIEAQGTFIGHFDYHIAAEFTSTPSAGASGILADAYVIADYFSFLKLQAGQFDVPFSLENRTSDKFIDFMERGTSVRFLAVPANKDMGAMAFGWLPKKIAYYSIGVFNGDGQNFRNQDGWGSVLGRVFVAPVAWLPAAQEKHKWLQDIWVGGSFWWQHNGNNGGFVGGASSATQNDRQSLQTTGGFTWLATNYTLGTDANGNNIRAHLVPGGTTVKWALEARIPVWKFGLQWELMHVSEDLFRYDDSVNIPNPTTNKWSGASFSRAAPKEGANLDGYGWYIEAFAWILGDVSFLETPGLEPAPRIKKFAVAKAPKWGLRVLARYEHVGVNIGGLIGVTDPMTGTSTADPASGNYELHTFGLGFDAWGTKHVRLSANYFMNYIDGDSALVKKNLYYQRPEHELLFRVGINL
jgi:hypothetical protein